MGSALIRLSPLAMMLFLAGCLPTTTTRIEGTEKAIAADVCRAWQPVTYSSRDTDQTKTEARANNAARDAYCREAAAP